MAENTPDAAPSFQALPTSLPRMEGRVLVVDDTEAKRYTVVRALKLAGMEVLEAESGQEALALVGSKPDVVLLDVRLPDMSGFEVCRLIKADPATASIAVLYLSAALRDTELEERLFEDGADGYIPQPLEPRHMVAQTWALVRMRRAELNRRREHEAAQAEQRRLHQELEQTRAWLQQLTEAGLVGVFSWELEGTILDANDTFLQMVGATREDLKQGRLDWKRMTPPEWEAQDRQGIQQMQSAGKRHLLEKQFLRKDGSRVDVMLGGVTFAGQPHRGVTMTVDLTELKATRQSLRLSEERLRLALESAALGVWSFVPDTHELEWDARTKELFRLSTDAPVSVDRWLETVHPDDHERVAEQFRLAMSGQNGGRFEAEYRVLGHPDGVLRWVASRARVCTGEDGRAHLLGTSLDITERKQNEQRTADLQATTAAIAQALTSKQVAEVVVAHVFQAVGAYAGAVSLVQDEQLVVLSSVGYPEHLSQRYRDVPLSQRTPASDAARMGEEVWVESFEDFERGWPEVARWLAESPSRSWGAIPLRVGTQVVGVLGLSFSTPRHLSAAEKAHLEALCHICAQALARARLFEEERRAKEAAHQREELEQQFLGVVSHDLRNPLAAISLGAHTLQRMERPAPEVLLRTARRIASSADTMGRMISDLLDFTRGRLGGGIPLERSMTDLVWLCHEVIDEFLVTHPGIDIHLEGDGVCEGWLDGARMRQVLSNLLSNALRHARPETRVSVRAHKEADEVVLSVFNEGSPIPEELLPVLFEPFRRGVAQFRPSGSLGLGLYIVRQVVVAHGGRVEVDTGEAGTTFTVRLPRRAPP
jgi:PAS domain S-box-containing protein